MSISQLCKELENDHLMPGKVACARADNVAAISSITRIENLCGDRVTMRTAVTLFDAAVNRISYMR